MNARNRSRLLFAGLLAGLLPLASDGGPLECCNVTTSLASSIAQPVAGDEDFFTMPTGPSSVMFLLDNSGSMNYFPQCTVGLAPATWGSDPHCSDLPVTAPGDPGTDHKPVFSGSCTAPAGNAMEWMNSVVVTDGSGAPLTTYADPGFSGGTGNVNDSPPWTPPNCSGSTCLFNPSNYYKFGQWTERSATPVATTATAGCAVLDGSGNVVKDAYGNDVVDARTGAGSCSDCMTNHGFYFFKAKYISNKNTGAVTSSPSSGTELRFRGTFLNANPPKYVSARRAIKQLLQIADTTQPTARDLIRYGLATFWNSDKDGGSVDNCSGTSHASGTLVVPLGPNCTKADPSNPDIAAIVSARNTLVGAVNATSASQKIKFDSCTPTAGALFNVGQYFSQPGTDGTFGARFGSTWIKTGGTGSLRDPGQDFTGTSPGRVNAPWASVPGETQASVCWACQQSAVVVVTDGVPKNDANLPSSSVSANHTTMPAAQSGWDFLKWQPAQYTAKCGAVPSSASNLCRTSDNTGSLLPLVAFYLANNDLWYNSAGSGTLAGNQSVTTHTVSFGVDSSATGYKTLDATAKLGGGTFTNTKDYSQLIAGIQSAVNAVVQRSTSFSATAANSLQTSQTTSTETFLARFRPNAGRFWEGHLFQATLFDEFANGCDPTVAVGVQSNVTCNLGSAPPNFNGDELNGKNRCDGAFLVDKNCKEITEDSLGNFITKETADLATPTAASLFWDAGKVLSDSTEANFRSAAEADVGTVKKRTIHTIVNGTKTEFVTANLTALMPLMALDQATCTDLLGKMGFTVGTPYGDTDKQNCAKQIIYYVRGYDVMDHNGDGCFGPGNPSNASNCPGKPSANTGQERDFHIDPKLWKLGDIFHSSPAVVKPPVDEVRCDIGFDSQCLPTIHGPAAFPDQTPLDSYTVSGNVVDAYEKYRLGKRSRKRVVLAGANDGMLHAFDAGTANTTTADVFGAYPYDAGTGEELWAFIPPDLLPRLKYMLYQHQYLVDGPTMVREVWVDGSNASNTSVGTRDGRKQEGEFHTVAILSERSGGTQFLALDLTDPTTFTFLWTFPPDCNAGTGFSDDAKYMGESWTDFAPRPPPIGPVKLAASNTRGFEERWIVMLNGGYDPAMLKGRAVFMLDVWTGTRLWRFTDDDFKANISARGASGTNTSMWPVPGAVALVDVGDTTKTVRDSDGFFDTATWADLGGNIWVARFQTPGTLTSGVVTNWWAGRAFEQQRRSDDKQYLTASGSLSPPAEVRSQFFYMTSNAFEPTTRTLRSFIGSGNREAMLVKDIACGPDNIMGCCQAGCTLVQTETVDNFGGCQNTQRFQCQDGLFARDPTSTNSTCGSTAPVCAATTNQFTSTTTYHMVCSGQTTDITAQTICDQNGVCSKFQTTAGTLPYRGNSRNLPSNLLTPPGSHNRYYGVWAYGRDATKMFDSKATAQTFDDNRFTDVAYTGRTCGGVSCTLVNVTQARTTYDPDAARPTMVAGCLDSSTKCSATVDDAGWFFEYGRVCPTADCTSSDLPWTDERTSSGSTIALGCAVWSGFRPVSAAVANPCDNTIGTPTVYAYGANLVTGAPTKACGYDDLGGTIYRAAQQTIWTPPHEPKIRVVVNAKGEVSYSALDVGNPGSPPVNKQIKTRKNVAETIYWLEAAPALHACRHVDATTCQ